MAEVKIEDSVSRAFEQYAGAVLQSRALVDVRDCVKPSARQIFYAMYTDGLTYDKPYKKTLKSIASAMRFFIHGDSSVEGTLMRSAQPFSMRYPLIDVEGSYGTQMDNESWAAPRYTSSKLSKIAEKLIGDTNNHTIEEWEDNYDDSEQYPRIFSSLGYYNIVNGSFGIGLGMASSIPQFNLREVNNALITLLENPDCDFEDIICYPDYASGGTIINNDEIVESLKDGTGKACIVRSTIDYNKEDNCLIVKDLPYNVYSNTICTEIEKYVDKNPDCGISYVNDLTGENVNIKIYLAKRVDYNKIISLLYENTSLQKSISINMTMLKDGRFPQVFGWREALIEHLKHEKKTYINYFSYELEKLKKRFDIVNGFLYVIENTDTVINIIKTSITRDNIVANLTKRCGLNYNQIEAILNMKLARLSNLDKDKYIEEKTELDKSIKNTEEILDSEDKLKQVMIDRFNEVSQEFGDERRTKLENITIDKASKTKKKIIEDVIIESVSTGLTTSNFDNWDWLDYIKKIPVAEYKSTDNQHFKIKSNELIWLFSNYGYLYRISAEDIKMCGNNDRGQTFNNLPIKLHHNTEHIILILPNRNDDVKPYIMFAFENGKVLKMAKKNLIGHTRNLKGQQLVKGNIVYHGIRETNGDVVSLRTSYGKRIDFEADKIRVSKSGAGRTAIKLADDDTVKSMRIITNRSYIQNPGGKGFQYEDIN